MARARSRLHRIPVPGIRGGTLTFTQDVTVSISILVGLIFLGMGLRVAGVLKDEHAGLLANLITHVTLPALIFIALSSHRFRPDQLLLAMGMISAELTCAFWPGG